MKRDRRDEAGIGQWSRMPKLLGIDRMTNSKRERQRRNRADDG